MKTLLITLLLLAFHVVSSADEMYDGYSKDYNFLRATTAIPSGTHPEAKIQASSEEAIQAAHRIFSRISFMFRSRADVIKILGDPATISSYGVPSKPDKESDLVYLFDSGFGGAKYTLKFRNGGVWSVSVEGLE
jgi:hypothetical protein